VNKYEVMYIVRPGDEDAINAVISKFEALINNNGGTVEKIDRWGKRRLAYEIKDTAEGFYCLTHFAGEPKTVFELDRVMKITEDILRHMVIKKDE